MNIQKSNMTYSEYPPAIEKFHIERNKMSAINIDKWTLLYKLEKETQYKEKLEKKYEKERKS